MVSVVMLGPPGSGKGTQSKILSEAFRLKLLATGDLFRQHLNSEVSSEVSASISRALKAGELVSDDLVIKMVEDFLLTSADEQGIIFDGFPRNLFQASALDGLLKKRHQRVDLVVSFNLEDDSVIERLAHRVVCRTCQAVYNTKFRPPRVDNQCDCCGDVALEVRADDDPMLIVNRLSLLRPENQKLLEYYVDREILEISAKLSVREISETLLSAVQKFSSMHA